MAGSWLFLFSFAAALLFLCPPREFIVRIDLHRTGVTLEARPRQLIGQLLVGLGIALAPVATGLFGGVEENGSAARSLLFYGARAAQDQGQQYQAKFWRQHRSCPNW